MRKLNNDKLLIGFGATILSLCFLVGTSCKKDLAMNDDKIYIIQDCLDTTEKTSFDVAMFHGQAERLINGLSTHSYLNAQCKEALKITRNIYVNPDIFVADFSFWVVSEDLKKKLEHFSDIKFQEVEYEKLYYQPFGQGSEPPIRNFHPDTISDFISKMDSLPKNLVKKKYYELILPDIRNPKNLEFEVNFITPLKDKFSNKKVVEIVDGFQGSMYASRYAGIVMSEEVFNIVREYINWDFFCYASMTPSRGYPEGVAAPNLFDEDIDMDDF